MCTGEDFSKIVEETSKSFTGKETDCCIVAKSIDDVGEIAMAGGDIGILYCIHTMLKQFAAYHNGTLEDALQYLRDIENGAYGITTEAKTLVFPFPD